MKSETSSHRKEIPGSDRQHPTSPQSSLDPEAQMVLEGAPGMRDDSSAG